MTRTVIEPPPQWYSSPSVTLPSSKLKLDLELDEGQMQMQMANAAWQMAHSTSNTKSQLSMQRGEVGAGVRVRCTNWRGAGGP